MKRVLIVALAAILSLTACGPAAQAQPTADPQLTAEALVGTIVAQTMQAIPTATPLPPTETPLPPSATPTSTVEAPAVPSDTATPTQELAVWTSTAVEYGPNFVRLKLINNSTLGCYWVQFAGGETYSISVCSTAFLYIRKGSYAYVVYFGLQRTFEGGITLSHKDQHAFEVYDDRVKFVIP
ncbi:MAG: hypothetical protein ACOYY3_20495 [Chloroflexota bacterium]